PAGGPRVFQLRPLERADVAGRQDLGAREERLDPQADPKSGGWLVSGPDLSELLRPSDRSWGDRRPGDPLYAGRPATGRAWRCSGRFFFHFDILRLITRGLIRFRRTASSVRSPCISHNNPPYHCANASGVELLHSG